MGCPRCEQENPAGVKFCGECGARLEWLYSVCRASNPPGNKFCHGCGAPLTGDGGAAKLASPHAYTPKYLAEKLLTSKSALEGERKQVTVLFADLKSSMELLVDRKRMLAPSFPGVTPWTPPSQLANPRGTPCSVRSAIAPQGRTHPSSRPAGPAT
jgi:hypothetical protein